MAWSHAQPLEIKADCPLISDLFDITNNNDDVIILEDNPTPPSPPSEGVELCQNGIYISSTGGQNINS